MSPSPRLAPASPSRCFGAPIPLPHRPSGATPRRSSSTAFARAHVSTSSPRWSAASTAAVCGATARRPTRTSPSAAPCSRIRELGGSVNLWVSALDSVAGVITLSSGVSADQLDRWRQSIERALRSRGCARAGVAVDDAVGPPGSHASAHVARRPRREGGVGEPGGRPRARRMGPARGSRRAHSRPEPRQASLPQAHEKAPLRVLQHVVPHHRTLIAQRSGAGCAPGSGSAHRHRVRPRPVIRRTTPPGRARACARRNRSALAAASLTVWPCRSNVASGERSVQSGIGCHSDGEYAYLHFDPSRRAGPAARIAYSRPLFSTSSAAASTSPSPTYC